MEDVFDRLLTRYRDMPGEAEFSSEALEAAAETARYRVANERTEASDPQLYHLVDDKRYTANLDLDRLQKRDSTSKKRRILNDHLERALKKLAKCLQN